MDDAIEVLEVFPDKLPDVWVFRYAFLCTVGEDVSSFGTSKRDVVNVQNGDVRDFGLEDIRDVIEEDGDRVHPTHRQGDKAEGFERRLKCGEVSGGLCKATLIITNIEVKHTSTSSAGEVFPNLVGERSNSGVLDRDLVEGFKAMDNSEGLSILFDNAEPTGLVRGVRGFVDLHIKFLLDQLADLFIEAGRYWNVLLGLWLVGDCQNLDWREEVFLEVSLLGVIPSKAEMLEAHKMVHERTLLRK